MSRQGKGGRHGRWARHGIIGSVGQRQATRCRTLVLRGLAGCMSPVTCLPPQQIAAPRERNDRGKSGRDVKHIFTVGLCKRVLQRKHETSETQCFFSSTVEVETWDRTTHPRQPQASDVCRLPSNVRMCHSCFCAHTSGRETVVTQ